MFIILLFDNFLYIVFLIICIYVLMLFIIGFVHIFYFLSLYLFVVFSRGDFQRKQSIKIYDLVTILILIFVRQNKHKQL